MEDDAFIGAFVVAVVALDGDQRGSEGDAGHVALFAIEAERSSAGTGELHFDLNDAVAEFLSGAHDGTVLVGFELGSTQGSIGGFPFALGGFEGGGEAFGEFGVEDDFPWDGEQGFISKGGRCGEAERGDGEEGGEFHEGR